MELVDLPMESSLIQSKFHYRKIHGSTGRTCPGFAHSAADGVFPGGPIGPPMSYAPGFMGGCGPCAGHGGCLPQGPCGCGGPNVHPGPCHLPGSNVCAGPGILPSNTVPPGPCPLPGYGICSGGGMGPGCGGFQPARSSLHWMRVWDDDERLAQCYVEWLCMVGCYAPESMGTRSLGRNLPHLPECPMQSRDLLRGGDLGVEETHQILTMMMMMMMMMKVVLPEMRLEAQQRRLHRRSVQC